MKNWLLFLCVSLLRPFLPRRQARGQILIVSTTGLGDTMWAIPALRALHRAGKHVSLLTGPYGNSLLKGCPYVERLFITSHAPLQNAMSLYRKLRAHSFEDIYVFHASQRPLFPLLALLKPRRMYGFRGRNKGNDHYFTHLKTTDTSHEIKQRLALIGYPKASPRMELFSRREQTTEQRIALFPGSKDAYKRWPEEYFIELGKRLAHLPYTLYIVGSKSEESLVTAIAQGIPGAHAVFSWPLEQTMEFMPTLSLCVANDSGPMHLAFAADIPTIALFSPTEASRYGPLNVPKATVVSRRAACTPCLRRKCFENFCMRQIAPHIVYNEAKQWLI